MKPFHYDILLDDLELGGAWSYKGTVKIQLQILDNSNKVVLNSLQLQIQSATLKAGDYSKQSRSCSDRDDVLTEFRRKSIGHYT